MRLSKLPYIIVFLIVCSITSFVYAKDMYVVKYNGDNEIVSWQLVTQLVGKNLGNEKILSILMLTMIMGLFRIEDDRFFLI